MWLCGPTIISIPSPNGGLGLNPQMVLGVA